MKEEEGRMPIGTGLLQVEPFGLARSAASIPCADALNAPFLLLRLADDTEGGAR